MVVQCFGIVRIRILGMMCWCGDDDDRNAVPRHPIRTIKVIVIVFVGGDCRGFRLLRRRRRVRRRRIPQKTTQFIPLHDLTILVPSQHKTDTTHGDIHDHRQHHIRDETESFFFLLLLCRVGHPAGHFRIVLILVRRILVSGFVPILLFLLHKNPIIVESSSGSYC